MNKLDYFTQRRMTRWVKDWKSKNGQLPTLKDLAQGGFPEEWVNRAVQDQILEQLYVTLTQGTIVKVYQVKS